MLGVATSFSSGGFSNHLLRSPQQQQAVSTFFQNLSIQHHGLYKCVPNRFYILI